MRDNGKFLVALLHGFTHKQVFFIVWFALVAVFVLLMMAYYRKYTQRNFRAPDAIQKFPPRIEARRLANSERSQGLTKKDPEPGGEP